MIVCCCHMRNGNLASSVTCRSTSPASPFREPHLHTKTHTNNPPLKLPETVDQTPGYAQTYRSLCTVALDLAVCPKAQDTRVKLNYRLVAPGPKKGLVCWLFTEKSSFSHFGIEGKNVVRIKEESPSLEDISVFRWREMQPVLAKC